MGEETGAQFQLTEICNGEHAAAMAADILAFQGSDLTIDASKVKNIDTPCIEVLIAAEKLWATDDVTLQYLEPSEAFLQGLQILGIELTQLSTMRSNHGG